MTIQKEPQQVSPGHSPEGGGGGGGLTVPDGGGAGGDKSRQQLSVSRLSKDNRNMSSRASGIFPNNDRRSSISSSIPGTDSSPKPDMVISFLEPLNPQYECPVCVQVLRYPVQFDLCGHRCCSNCLSSLLRVDQKCPRDGKRIDRERVYVDKKFQREVDEIKVKCSSHEHGCTWEGILKDLTMHNEDCKYILVDCVNKCGTQVEKRNLQKHMEKECNKRSIICEFCEEDIVYDEEIDHLNVCLKFPVPCPNHCKAKKLPREQITSHLEKECPKQKIVCPFGSAGCKFKAERKEIEKHCDAEKTDHLRKLCNLVMTQRQRISEIKQKSDGEEKQIEALARRVETLEKLYGAQIVWKIDGFKQKLAQAKTGEKPTQFSPAFLTSRHGYKLALSACLFGDGKARGKFLSLFCCICKGEYDALLLWPFAHRLIFTLVDQCQDPEARRNVTYQVKPNSCKENKPFLGRPIGERNASFGAQKFVELDVLKTNDYIRDDTLFIKVEIDSTEIPKL